MSDNKNKPKLVVFPASIKAMCFFVEKDEYYWIKSPATLLWNLVRCKKATIEEITFLFLETSIGGEDVTLSFSPVEASWSIEEIFHIDKPFEKPCNFPIELRPVKVSHD
jgi:hypothetical protein